MDVKGIYCIIHVGFEQLPDPISEMDPWKKSQVMKQSFLLKQRQNLIGGADIDLELMTSDIHVYANGSP